MFNLPGRGFRQRITLTSSVPMTLNDVIVHVRQFVIALVSVDGCSSFPDPDGFFDVPDSSVRFLAKGRTTKRHAPHRACQREYARANKMASSTKNSALGNEERQSKRS